MNYQKLSVNVLIRMECILVIFNDTMTIKIDISFNFQINHELNFKSP